MRLMVGIVALSAVALFLLYAPTEELTAIEDRVISPSSCVAGAEDLKQFIHLRIESALGELEGDDFHRALDSLVDFWIFFNRCAMELHPYEPAKRRATTLYMELTVFIDRWRVAQIFNAGAMERLTMERLANASLESVLSAIERVQYGGEEYDR